MNHRAQIRMLPDGRRMHLHDGPIDVVLEAIGPATEIEAAYRAAEQRFVTVLDELCSELIFLRRPAYVDAPLPQGVIARRMVAAVRPSLRKLSSRPWPQSPEPWRKKFWPR